MPSLPVIDVELLNPVFEVFRRPEIALWIAAIIIAVAGMLLLWFMIFRAAPALFSLQLVKRRLRSLNGHSALVARFSEVDEAISKVRMLRHGWSEFKETLILPRQGESAPIRNTARPAAYLNVGTIAPELHLPFYQAVPNYFVGVGLLFTFVGLVAALHFASEGVAGKSPAEAQEALQALLSAATFKFSTSIAGLFSSLVFSIALKWLTIQLQIHFDRLCKLLEERLVAITPEGLAVEQTRELEKQTEQLQRFNTDFAVEVAKALEDKLNQSLAGVISTAVQPMVSAIDGMAKNFGEMNQDAMQRIVQDFQRSLQGAAGTEMQAIGSSLGRLGQALEVAVEKMETSGGQFGRRMEDAATQLEILIGGAGKGLQAQIGDAANRLDSLMQEMSRTIHESLTGASTQLETAASGIGDKLQSAMGPLAIEFDRVREAISNVDAKLRVQLGSFDTSVELLTDLSRELGGLLAQIRDAGAPLSTVADRLQNVASRFDQTSGVIGEAHTKLTDVAKTILAGAEVVNGSWEKYRDRFERVDQDLERAFAKLHEGTMAYHQKLTEYVKEIDGHFTQAINLLGGVVQELRDSVEDLAETAGRINHAAE